jgi:hypothetical protein
MVLERYAWSGGQGKYVVEEDFCELLLYLILGSSLAQGNEERAEALDLGPK